MQDNVYYLNKLGITGYARIGGGQESDVYDIGNGRVLKLLKRADSVTLLQRKKELYDRLHKHTTSFKFPRILEISIIEDVQYLIEEKLNGTSLETILSQTTSVDLRTNLLHEMLTAICVMQSITFEDSSFQECIAESPISAESWSIFFEKRVKRICEKNIAPLSACVTEHDALIDDYLEKARALFPDDVKKSFVHGDYWPPNILIADGAITAIIDCNDQTLMGDYRIDVASAIIFSETFVTTDEMEFLKADAKKLFGHDIERFINLYTIYYALAFINVAETDPKVYVWAKNQLQNYHQLFF